MLIQTEGGRPWIRESGAREARYQCYKTIPGVLIGPLVTSEAVSFECILVSCVPVSNMRIQSFYHLNVNSEYSVIPQDSCSVIVLVRKGVATVSEQL